MSIERVYELVRQIFPSTTHLRVERVAEGVSTWVYRVRRRDETFYLRILPEADASFAPEVLVHQRLHALGVHVPEVVHFEHHNQLVQRSVMVTTEIRGTAVGYGKEPTKLRKVFFQTGQELAMVNSMPVNGFGWIRRDIDQGDQLHGEHASCAAWVQQDTEAAIEVLQQAGVVSAKHAQAIDTVLQQAAAVWADQPAHLAHGDFDPTHIYHHQGTYTGIIDFGEIRGTPRWYDVGHFAIENADLLPDLLTGYSGTLALTANDWQHIYMWSVLIAVRRAGRRLMKYPKQVYQPDVEAIQRGLQMLISKGKKYR